MLLDMSQILSCMHHVAVHEMSPDQIQTLSILAAAKQEESKLEMAAGLRGSQAHCQGFAASQRPVKVD